METHWKATEAAYKLQHRLMMGAKLMRLYEQHPGGLVTRPMAEYLLGVSNARVRALIEAGTIREYQWPEGDAVIGLIPLADILAAPSDVHRGGPMAVRDRDGAVVRNQGEPDGLVRPMLRPHHVGEGRAKNLSRKAQPSNPYKPSGDKRLPGRDK